MDPLRLNQTLLTPVHREPSINGILPKLTDTYYMTLIDTGSGYHKQKLIKKNHLIYSCQHVSLAGTGS